MSPLIWASSVCFDYLAFINSSRSDTELDSLVRGPLVRFADAVPGLITGYNHLELDPSMHKYAYFNITHFYNPILSFTATAMSCSEPK